MHTFFVIEHTLWPKRFGTHMHGQVRAKEQAIIPFYPAQLRTPTMGAWLFHHPLGYSLHFSQGTFPRPVCYTDLQAA